MGFTPLPEWPRLFWHFCENRRRYYSAAEVSRRFLPLEVWFLPLKWG
jgi:hypothetical protein